MEQQANSNTTLDLGAISSLKDISMSLFYKVCVLGALNCNGDMQKYSFYVSHLEMMLYDEIKRDNEKLKKQGKENESYQSKVDAYEIELETKKKLGEDLDCRMKLLKFKFQELFQLVKRDIPIEAIGVL